MPSFLTEIRQVLSSAVNPSVLATSRRFVIFQSLLNIGARVMAPFGRNMQFSATRRLSREISVDSVTSCTPLGFLICAWLNFKRNTRVATSPPNSAEDGDAQVAAWPPVRLP